MNFDTRWIEMFVEIFFDLVSFKISNEKKMGGLEWDM